ncbi:Putative formate dehydrogenase-specific chaperone [hydrothermal vent metagenome]|uniref:Formate dehydrogenase-specific chaperone n=1 Tax=hydrothermal vent metagenome TaxID=652676 RepID=A0A3B0SZH1_9ZZZZ
MAIEKAAVSAAQSEVPEEDQLRANLYNYLGRCLVGPPDAGLLAVTADFIGDDTEIGQAMAALARLARNVDPGSIGREYHDLFIGVGRGELVPFASYYLTGFLHEKPLAKLRGTMGELGIARSPDVKEPEDHIGSLMEMMAGLITGKFGAPADIEVQKAFFATHVETWAAHFFKDLEAAKASVFYQPIGRLGVAYMGIEAQAFSMS